MGVDTKAIIRKGTTLKQIKETLEKKYGEVKIRPTSSNYYFTAVFNDGNDQRMLSMFFNDFAKSDYQLSGVLLSLGYNVKSIEVMNCLLDEFGGYLNEKDSDDEGFKPINIEAYKESVEFTKEDEFRNEIAHKLGYDNIETTMLLFEKYKSIKN
jgi:hypothetical protein